MTYRYGFTCYVTRKRFLCDKFQSNCQCTSQAYCYNQCRSIGFLNYKTVDKIIINEQFEKVNKVKIRRRLSVETPGVSVYWWITGLNVLRGRHSSVSSSLSALSLTVGLRLAARTSSPESVSSSSLLVQDCRRSAHCLIHRCRPLKAAYFSLEQRLFFALHRTWQQK